MIARRDEHSPVHIRSLAAPDCTRRRRWSFLKRAAERLDGTQAAPTRHSVLQISHHSGSHARQHRGHCDQGARDRKTAGSILLSWVSTRDRHDQGGAIAGKPLSLSTTYLRTR